MGWIATRHEKTLAAMAKQKDYSTICNPVVTEWLSALALRHGEKLITRNRSIVEKNREAFEGFLARNPGLFAWTPPSGGTMGFVWRLDGKSMEPFAKFLLEREGLMLLSGKYFDTDEKYFRIGLGRKNFTEALAVLEKHLEQMA
jgi:aspartate/methionine/tyrosine aminotransferase